MSLSNGSDKSCTSFCTFTVHSCVANNNECNVRFPPFLTFKKRIPTQKQGLCYCLGCMCFTSPLTKDVTTIIQFHSAEHTVTMKLRFFS